MGEGGGVCCPEQDVAVTRLGGDVTGKAILVHGWHICIRSAQLQYLRVALGNR